MRTNLGNYLALLTSLICLSGCQALKPKDLLNEGDNQTLLQTELSSQSQEVGSRPDRDRDLIAGLYVRVDSWVGWDIVDVVDRQHYFFSLLPGNQARLEDQFGTHMKVLSITEDGIEIETDSQLLVIEDTPSEAIYGRKDKFTIKTGEFLGLETLSEDETFRYYFYLLSIHDQEKLQEAKLKLRPY